MLRPCFRERPSQKFHLRLCDLPACYLVYGKTQERCKVHTDAHTKFIQTRIPGINFIQTRIQNSYRRVYKVHTNTHTKFMQRRAYKFHTNAHTNSYKRAYKFHTNAHTKFVQTRIQSSYNNAHPRPTTKDHLIMPSARRSRRERKDELTTTTAGLSAQPVSATTHFRPPTKRQITISVYHLDPNLPL